jgi:aquaporin Z
MERRAAPWHEARAAERGATGARDKDSHMKKAIAEFIGTFILVFFGCGSAVIAGAEIGVVGISFAFGLALIAGAYGIGPISGCHINPAVSLAALIADRMEIEDFARYVAAQVLGAIAGAAVLLLIVSDKVAGYDVATAGLGQNGWGPGYLGEFGLVGAFVFEAVATFIFLVVILGSTQQGAPGAMAGLAIGLTLVVIHIVGIQVTGVSVNPARSIGPAIFVGGQAIAQLWLFIVAPLVGAAAAGLLFRNGVLEADGN